jgi:hypothetical protein
VGGGALPRKEWLKHLRVHRLCRIPKGQFSFIPYDHFTGKERKGQATWAKWDVDLLLVANPEGLASSYKHEDLASAIRSAVGRDDLVVAEPDSALWAEDAPKVRGLAKAVRCFDAGELGSLPEGPRHRAQHGLSEPPPLELLRHAPIRP